MDVDYDSASKSMYSKTRGSYRLDLLWVEEGEDRAARTEAMVSA